MLQEGRDIGTARRIGATAGADDGRRCGCEIESVAQMLHAGPRDSLRREEPGLVEIRERMAALGGTLRLVPRLECGTDFIVEIPLEASTWA